MLNSEIVNFTQITPKNEETTIIQAEPDTSSTTPPPQNDIVDNNNTTIINNSETNNNTNSEKLAIITDKKHFSTPPQSPHTIVSAKSPATASTNCINKNSTRNLLSLLNSLTYKECTWPFLQPVSPIDYPDYHSIITTPKDMSTITRTLRNKEYPSVIELANDVVTMCKNSLLYNPPQNIVYKHAETFYSEFKNGFLKIFPETLIPPLREEEETGQKRSKREIKPPKMFKQESYKSRNSNSNNINTNNSSNLNLRRRSSNLKSPQQKRKRSSISSSSSVSTTTRVSSRRKSSTTRLTTTGLSASSIGKRTSPTIPKRITQKEKLKLSRAIMKLPPQQLVQVINIVGIDGSEDVELDLNAISDSTCHDLVSFVKGCGVDGGDDDSDDELDHLAAASHYQRVLEDNLACDSDEDEATEALIGL